MGLIKEMLQTVGRLRVCWLGNDGWLISHDGHLVATDLDFFLPERALPPFEELPALAESLDYLLVTHAHTDHFNPQTIGELLAHGRCTLILPESCRACAREYGLDPGRIIFARPGRVPLDLHNNPLPLPRAGGEVPGLPLWLGVEAIGALHGSVGGAVYAGASRDDCGYIISVGGKRIVQPGDSVLLDEHLTLAGTDLLFVSPTEHNMGVESARRLIETVRPAHVFAQHFKTYHETSENAFWTHGFQEELAAALSAETRKRFTIPAFAKPYLIE